jgi:hypothetical protein
MMSRVGYSNLMNEKTANTDDEFPHGSSFAVWWLLRDRLMDFYELHTVGEGYLNLNIGHSDREFYRRKMLQDPLN